jgi:hypothetical protein
MSFDRTTLLKSPGKLVHDSASIFSEGDIVTQIITEFFPVETSAHGVVDQRVKDRMLKIALTPKSWTDLTKLFPYATKQIGDTLFGASDKAAVITPRNGGVLTVANAMLTKLPSILLAGTKPILGAMEFTGLVANNSDAATVANFLGFGSPATGTALSGFSLATIPNGLYSAVWNGVTIRSSSGFAIEFNLGLEPDNDVDGEPTLNFRVVSLDATVKFTPAGMTEANFLTLLALNKGIGAAPTKSDIVITGASSGMPIVTIANCFVESSNVGHGKTVARTGEVTLRSIRTETSGSLNALWTFGAVA